MTKEAELVKRLEKIYEGEDLFPGVLGNPVTFAARWGLPLSKSYLKHLDARRTAANRRRSGNGRPASARPRKSTKARTSPPGK